MLLLFLCLSITTAFDKLNLFREKTNKLHKLIQNVSTFYELFGLSENTSLSSIKKAYRRKIKSPAPKNFDKEEYTKLINDGYMILTTQRKEYDLFLGNSKWAYLDDAKNYTTQKWLLVLVMIVGLFALDGCIYLFRYVRFLSLVEEQRAAKKDRKESVNGSRESGKSREKASRESAKSSSPRRKGPVQPPMMLAVKLFRKFLRR